MKFIVSKDLFGKYPDVRIGVIIAKNIDNKSENLEITEFLKNIQDLITEEYIQNPTIVKWRQIYSSFGSKPSDYRSLIEALIRSILKSRRIGHINRLVDLYNYISLKYVITAGGEDLEKIEGNINLKFATGGESFVPLNSANTEQAYPGEVIYCDDAENVLCRRWNWRESDKTKLTEATKNAIIVLEGFDDNVSQATEELEKLVQEYCNATTLTYFIDREYSECEWQ